MAKKSANQGNNSRRADSEKSKGTFNPDWKSIGIGVIVGALLLTIVMAAGGNVEEWNFGIMKVKFPTPNSIVAQTTQPPSTDIPFTPVTQTPYVIQPTSALPALISISYNVDGWNSRLVDLRTAKETGIFVVPTDALKFFDLYVYEAQDPGTTKLQVEFYALKEDDDDDFIGLTERLLLTKGMNYIEKISVRTGYQHEKVSNAWAVQSNWDGIEVNLIQYDENDVKINVSTTVIKLNPNSKTWLTTPPDVSFASIAYTINGGPELWMDFHQVLTDGLNLHPNDQLKITQIWYRAEDFKPGMTLGVEATIIDDENSGSGYHNDSNNSLEAGVHLLSNEPSPFEWVVTEKDVKLVLTMARSDGAVVDRLDIPVFLATK